MTEPTPNSTIGKMTQNTAYMVDDLIGIGLYTPVEAGRLVQVGSAKISRWLRGHEANGKHYDPLWTPQVDLGEDGIVLGFRDLQEVRVAAAFIDQGLSAQRVRQAILLARDLVSDVRPLSTTRFRSDGRTVFLQVVQEDGQTKLIDLFKKQLAFKEIIERSLTNLEYNHFGIPALWWPLGKKAGIVLDPARSFGAPIDAETAVPVSVLVDAVCAEGSNEAAAKVWDVPVRAIRRALAFQREMDIRLAA